jgi:hypothetical protein
MRTCIYAALLITIESSAFAGTLYPTNPYYVGVLSGGDPAFPPGLPYPGETFLGETIQATDNAAAMLQSTTTSWSASLMVERVEAFASEDENGTFESKDVWNLTLPSGWDSMVPAEPIPGLPNGFHVEAVSTDYKWVTDGTQLYHVPSPTSGALAMVMLLCLPALKRFR